jgi:hypothetical protein
VVWLPAEAEATKIRMIVVVRMVDRQMTVVAVQIHGEIQVADLLKADLEDHLHDLLMEEEAVTKAGAKAHHQGVIVLQVMEEELVAEKVPHQVAGEPHVEQQNEK